MPISLAIPLALAAAKVGSDIYTANKREEAAKASAAELKKQAEANKKLAEENFLAQFGETSDEAGIKTMGLDQLTNLNNLIASGKPYKGYGDYSGDLAIDMADLDITQDPSYQFRLQEGLDALEGKTALTGGRRSGAHEKALMDYAQGLASTEYGNAYTRDYTRKVGNREADYRNYLTQLMDYNTRARNEISDLTTMAGFGERSLGREGAARNALTAAQTGQNATIGQSNAITAGAQGGGTTALIQGLPNAGMDILGMLGEYGYDFGGAQQVQVPANQVPTSGQSTALMVNQGFNPQLFNTMNTPGQAPWLGRI